MVLPLRKVSFITLFLIKYMMGNYYIKHNAMIILTPPPEIWETDGVKTWNEIIKLIIIHIQTIITYINIYFDMVPIMLYLLN